MTIIKPRKLPANFPIRFSDEQMEITIGSLLGDGGLTKPTRDSFNSCFRVLRATSDIEYLQWHRSKIEEFCTASGITSKSCFDKRTGKAYNRSRFNTRSAPLFTKLRREWYDDAGIKHVPNIQLTPLTVAV